jgi:NADH-quinone oxidoreductase subunit N
MNYTDLFRVTLPETALEVAALLVLLVDLGLLRNAAVKVRAAVAALLGVVGCGVGLVLVLQQGTGGLSFESTHELLLATGGFTAVAQAGVLVLTALTLLLVIDTDFTRHVGEFVAVILMAAAGGLLISGAQDLLVIFVGLELLSLGLYILTAFAKSSGRSAEAAMKYYLFGGMSAAFLLFGFSYLYGLTGSTNLHEILLGLYGPHAAQTAPLLYVAIVMIAAGLGFKVAAVPFHLWAPDAYEGAPAPAAAFIASVSKVASFALLISIGTAALHVLDGGHGAMRVLLTQGNTAPQPNYLGFNIPWSFVLTVFAAASMLLGNLAALAQTSVRRLLAYSAIAHAGYVLLGLAFFSYSPRSAGAILYYVLTYGLTTIGAFGVIGVVERATGSDKLLAAVLLVLFLSLAGIPPLVGFWAKFNLFAAALSVSNDAICMGLVALAVAMSAVSLYYYLQVLKRAYVQPAVDETPIKVHPVSLIVLLAIAAAVVLLGVFPAVLQGWIAGFYPAM